MCVCVCVCVCVCCAAQRCDNFIVGLTNVSPNVSPPTLRNYTMCGQYPGKVPAAATVSLYCHENLPAFRYLIVQFEMTDHMNICELQVFEKGISTQLSSRAVARILFQPRQRGKPRVWSGAPSEVQGQSPWSGGEAESFLGDRLLSVRCLSVLSCLSATLVYCIVAKRLDGSR